MKNILLINSSKKPSQDVLGLFKALKEEGFSMHLISSNNKIIEEFKNDNFFVKKAYFGPKVNEKESAIIFYLLLPLLCFRHFFSLLYLKIKYKIDLLVCFSWNERIIFTPLAKILKMEVVWLEKPGVEYNKALKVTVKVLRLICSKVKIIVFTEATKKKLEELNFKKANIVNVSLGIKTDFHKHQENIFSNLARAIDLNSSKGCFTVGVISDLNRVYQMENIFRAIKICLNGFSNLRLIIIGEGKERKQLSWLAKQNGIESYVYLVGNQTYLGNWWESFDVYLASNRGPKITDSNMVLKAMFTRLPTITFHGEGVEEVLMDNKNGFLIPPGEPEILAEKIIRLQQDSDLKNKMGERGRKLVEDHFVFSEQLERLKKEL
ncbi:glycosyltransferase [bacterium]|nr:glycosyltransferase [bacterium]